MPKLASLPALSARLCRGRGRPGFTNSWAASKSPSAKKLLSSNFFKLPNTRMVDRIAKFFTSLRLTVALLGAGLLLVFIGTLAQVDEGLYAAQTRYFKSWLIWAPTMFGAKVPILFPGGY